MQFVSAKNNTQFERNIATKNYRNNNQEKAFVPIVMKLFNFLNHFYTATTNTLKHS